MSARRPCPFEEELLLLDDEGIPFARRIALEAHLAGCPSCAGTEEALERVGESLRRGPSAPLGAVERALQGLAREEARPRAAPWLLASSLAAASVAALLLAAPRLRGPVEVAERPLEVARDPRAERPAETRPPSPPPAEGASPPLPPIPPPLPAKGPPIESLLDRIDFASESAPGAVAAAAARVVELGAAGSASLAAALLSAEPERSRRALAVALHAPSPALVEPLSTLLRDPARARLAARALGACRAARAVPSLAAALDGPAASEAREALVEIGGPEAARIFERRLVPSEGPGAEDIENLDALARIDSARAARLCAQRAPTAAARAVLARHRDRLLADLRRLAASGDESSGAGAFALGLCGDAGSLELLARLATRPRSASGATRGLLALGSDAAFDAAFRAACRAPEARAAFDGAGAAAERFLLARLDGGLHAERRAALELLARCGGAATVARLDARPVERGLLASAAETLGAVGGERAVALLARMGSERSVRREVIRALGATELPSALAPLRAFAGDEGSARELCDALARIHAPGSAELLLDLAARGSAAEAAARALVEMPARVVVPVLLGRIEGGAGGGRARALLARIAGTDLGPKPETWSDWWESHSRGDGT